MGAKLKDGRKWSVNSSGIKSLTRTYVIPLDAVTSANGESVSFAGVPAIGSAHPSFSGLVVDSYDVEEGRGAAKNTLTVTVHYSVKDFEVGEGTSEEEEYECEVDEWGWQGSTVEKELTCGVDGTPVLNTAGDPFDRVPTISSPAPTFIKVMKFSSRQTAMSYNCSVNEDAMTIGGMACPAHSLLCSVSEKRLIGETFKYQYTVQLRFRSNKIVSKGEESEIGWDVAVLNAGMRERDSGSLKIIRKRDTETGQMCKVTSPALLDEDGKALDETQTSEGSVINLVFQAYPRMKFPSWFTSEPL